MKFVTKMEDILSTQKYFWSQNDKPGAADFLVWPWIERLEALCTISTGKDPRILSRNFVISIATHNYNYLSRYS